MEVLIAIGVLAFVALLASRFGHDSRDGFESKERSLAGYGMTWTDLHDPVADRGTSAASQAPEPNLVLPVPVDPKPVAA